MAVLAVMVALVVVIEVRRRAAFGRQRERASTGAKGVGATAGRRRWLAVEQRRHIRRAGLWTGRAVFAGPHQLCEPLGAPYKARRAIFGGPRHIRRAAPRRVAWNSVARCH